VIPPYPRICNYQIPGYSDPRLIPATLEPEAHMVHVRKTTEELIAEEERRSEQGKARIAELKARQKTEERRRDTHRKVFAGATLIAHVRIDPRFRRAVQEAFNKAVTDPKRRAVILDLLDETAFNRSMQAANKEAAEAKGAEEAEKQPAPPTRPAQQHNGARSAAPPPTGAVLIFA